MTPRSVYGILLAAGSGSRLGVSVPKAFVEYQGVSILLRSFRTLLSTKAFSKIVVTIPESLLAHAECDELRRCGAIVIAGGKTRRDSVALALSELKSKVSGRQEETYVLIHDAARCFATPGLILQTVQAVVKYDAVTTGVPAVDSIKIVGSDGIVERSLPRETLWSVQTPQAFRFDLIWRAHQDFHGEATDDASMVEKFTKVRMIQGASTNRKITLQEDLL